MKIHRIPLSFLGAALVVLTAIWIAVTTTEVRAAEDGVFPHERSDLPKKKNATAGKYLYVGTAPRFAPEDLELVTSKVGLTLRVSGRVTQELRDTYALFLYKRFRRIADAFLSESSMSFVPYKSLATLEATAKRGSTKLWLKIAAPYATHVLEGRGVSIERHEAGKDAQKREVLTALLRYYLNNADLTLESLPLLDLYFQNADYVRQLSHELFAAHLGPRFTAGASAHAKTGKTYIGTLHYVYPIAATTEGPFDQPREGVREFGLSGNIESRIWSEKWDDEFGGLPFLLVEWSGVAFHGPITNFAPLDLWYLRRDYVSHGCHRMDSSDILELRALMPAELSRLQALKKPIRHVTLSWPDVIDLDQDGKLEALDVQYYDLPTWLPEPKKGADLDAIAGKSLGDAAQASWRKKHYLRFNKHANAQGSPVYDPLTGLYSGLPRYEVEKGKLLRKGVHDPVQVLALPYQPSRILQYNDGRPMPQGFDNRSGKYSPDYFIQ